MAYSNECILGDGSIFGHFVGFRDSTKMGSRVGWVEERNPTKDNGMLNPTYK
jgi:hypothetical protein